ncbi:hypothetical protein HGRIS_011404 [Hohenbuehelia grisea]|uniref:Uncharacterized protein n=1 Tax=Hohenbuehelia grisea TaxID=104357 RepID=A0ABR3JX68_9AGAR
MKFSATFVALALCAVQFASAAPAATEHALAQHGRCTDAPAYKTAKGEADRLRSIADAAKRRLEALNTASAKARADPNYVYVVNVSPYHLIAGAQKDWEAKEHQAKSAEDKAHGICKDEPPAGDRKGHGRGGRGGRDDDDDDDDRRGRGRGGRDRSPPRRGNGRGGHRDRDDSPNRGRGRGGRDDSPPRRGNGRGGDRDDRGRGRGGDRDRDRSPPRRGNGRDRDDSPRRGNGRDRGRDRDRSPPRRGGNGRGRDRDDSPPRRGNGRDRDRGGPRRDPPKPECSAAGTAARATADIAKFRLEALQAASAKARADPNYVYQAVSPYHVIASAEKAFNTADAAAKALGC